MMKPILNEKRIVGEGGQELQNKVKLCPGKLNQLHLKKNLAFSGKVTYTLNNSRTPRYIS